MKIPLIFRLVFWITVTTQIGSSQIISKNGNKEIITENGTTDIEITKPEILDIYVLNNVLAFEVCSMTCLGDFLACYESDPPGQTPTKFVGDRCETKCGFFVTGNKNAVPGKQKYVSYMEPAENLERAEECDISIMRFHNFTARPPGYDFFGCLPKISENGMIKLNVTNASFDCPVKIKNAKLTLDVPTTVLPSNNDPKSPSNSNSKKSPSSKSPATNIFGIFGCIFVLISIYLFHHQ